MFPCLQSLAPRMRVICLGNLPVHTEPCRSRWVIYTSFPVAFESYCWIKSRQSVVQQPLWRLLMVLLWSPPAETVAFQHWCVSGVHTGGPRSGLCTESWAKLNADILWCEQGRCRAGRFNPLRATRSSEPTCPWMFGFHRSLLVPAEADYLQAPCFWWKLNWSRGQRDTLAARSGFLSQSLWGFFYVLILYWYTSGW